MKTIEETNKQRCAHQCNAPEDHRGMKELGKKKEPLTYEDAGHGFMRAGTRQNPQLPDQVADQKAADEYQKALTAYKANKKARDEA